MKLSASKILDILCVMAIVVSLVVIVSNKIQNKPKVESGKERITNESAADTMPQMELLEQSCLVFEHSTIDFGTIKGDSLLVADFVLTNSCDTTACIFGVNPECSCTSYYVSKYDIPANDTALIRLTFNTKDRYGENRVYATVKDNSEEMHRLMLKVNIEE